MKKVNLKVFLIYFILLKPNIINTLSSEINNIFNYIMIGTTLIIIYIYLYKKKEKIEVITIILLFYFGILLFSTIYNKINMYYFFKEYVQYVGVILYTIMLIKKDYVKTIENLAYFFGIIIIINFISILLLPHNSKQERNFFLGYDNAFAPTIILGTYLIIFYSYFKFNKLNLFSIIVIFITIFSCFIVESSTSKVAAVLLIFFLIIIVLNKKLLSKLFINYKLFLIISTIFVLLFVVYRLQNHFKYIIVDLLNRDLTFTGRTQIWDNAIFLIKKSPIIGNGVMTPDYRAMEYGVYHAHCTILNILLEGGICALSVYYIILFIVGKKIKDNSKILANILNAGFCTYFIMTISEYYYKKFALFIFIIISFYYKLYFSKKEN